MLDLPGYLGWVVGLASFFFVVYPVGYIWFDAILASPGTLRSTSEGVYCALISTAIGYATYVWRKRVIASRD